MVFARLIGLVALLTAELWILMVRFSTQSLEAAGQAWWADTLWRWKIVLPPLAIAMSTAGILLGGDRLREELRRVSTEIRTPHRPWPYLVGHLTAFVIFAWLTAFILEGSFTTSAVKPLWVGVWLATAAAAAAFWAASLMAPRVLLAVLWRARALVVLIAAVGAMAWVAGRITEGLWDPLRHATMNLVAALVHLMAPDPVFVPEDLVVGTERFWVRILSVCAGYEGIGLIWVFLSAYLVTHRQELRFPRALLLIPIGTLAVWLANALRLTVLIAIGTWISNDVALGGFHSYSGSLLFSGVALALVWAARRSSYFSATPIAAADAAIVGPNVTAAYLAPFLAIVATQMLAGAASTGGTSFDLWYPARVLAAGAALVAFRGVYREVRWTCSWAAAGVGVGVFVLWMALEPTPEAARQATFGGALEALGPAWMTVWLAFRVIGSVVTVPIAEELAFRGYLHRRLVDADFDRVAFRRFTWTAFVVSSLLFGVMHGRWFAGTLAGMCYALVMYRRGELGDAIAAHAITNGLIAAWVLATGHWLLW
ncbi:MAG: exosortase E/protease, VPEID-CTERM system [Deltaproteobacteria bacterium]|nr:exosortase E/protease, VPEID-CTERM system [Deltaproteobacteria bacterium]